MQELYHSKSFTNVHVLIYIVAACALFLIISWSEA